MPVIVISGKPGCGSSTNAKLLAKKLKLKHFSVGDYNKRHAKKAKKETDKSIEMWHLDKKTLNRFHHDSDKLANDVAERGNVVIDGKLGIHLIKKHDLTVWLTASKKVQAERYAKRDKIPAKEAMKKVLEKEKLERANWKKIYGFDYFHQAKEADLVINTGDKTPEQIVDLIIKKLKN
ncbi:MAG TPA: cytidylate kinase family protein [archaeon]|nr:cytidylate kinase family protein [archaeon]